MTPFNDDDDLDKRALLDQLGVKSPVDGPETDAPVSTTMPVTDNSMSVTPARAAMVAAGARGGAASTPIPPPAQGRIFQGFTPTHPMEGFAFDREQNTGKSAKDAFADLANQAPPPPLNDKAALAAWFRQYIEPGMNALGHQVTSVDGDKFGFRNWQGEFTVDYGRGAGADGGALAWQVDDPTAVLSNGTYQPVTAPSVPMDVNAPDQQAAIMAEIDALINGGNSPMDQRALLALLQEGAR